MTRNDGSISPHSKYRRMRQMYGHDTIQARPCATDPPDQNSCERVRQVARWFSNKFESIRFSECTNSISKCEYACVVSRGSCVCACVRDRRHTTPDYNVAASGALTRTHTPTHSTLSKSQVKQHSQRIRVHAKWQAHYLAGTTALSGRRVAAPHFTLSMLSLSIVMCITFYLPCSCRRRRWWRKRQRHRGCYRFD